MRLLFLFIFCLVPHLFFAQDGIALNTVNGKPAISHQVQPGETLYFISRKYNTTVAQLKQDNPMLLQNDLKVNTTIVIYYNKAMLVDISQANPANCWPLLHQVKKGETLFGLSKRTYQLEVGDLKLWNRLQSNEISIGQNLIVGWISSNANYAQNLTIEATAAQDKQVSIKSQSSANNQTPTSEETGRIVYVSKGIPTGNSTDSTNTNVYISPKNPFAMEQKKVAEASIQKEESTSTAVENTNASTKEKIAAENTSMPIITEEKLLPPTANQAPIMETDKRLGRDIFAEYENDTSGRYTLMNERGPAKWFKPNNGSLQLYALHKIAPVGTVLKIANPINNYTVYVKVVQQLPATDENQNALLKISSNAMELLKVYDKVFMVDVSYYLQK